ncbi:MAG: ChrR family anti-sigma-E factor [Pseudomonadales bacterium]
MVSLHPDTGFLTEYSSGSLSPAQNISVSAHLHFCRECRDHVDCLDEIGGVLLEQIAPAPLGPDSFEQVLLKLEDTAPASIVATEPDVASDELIQLPKLVRRLLPGDTQWRRLSPSLAIARIPVGECRFELALHKIRPGGRAPTHDHKGLEITVVLQGSFSDDDGVYREGDFIVREPGDVHTPIATQNEMCICLSACEAPVRMVGPIKRLLNPFIRFKPV